MKSARTATRSVVNLAGVLALCTALLGTACTSVRNSSAPAEDSEAQTQIERRLREVLAAAESKDFERLESCHLYGPKFTRFSSASADRQDAAATRKVEHDGLAPLQGLKMRPEALKIDVFDRVGIATFILDATFESAGAPTRRRDRSTLVFVKERGEWRIAHEHSSPITPAEGAPANASLLFPFGRCAEAHPCAVAFPCSHSISTYTPHMH